MLKLESLQFVMQFCFTNFVYLIKNILFLAHRKLGCPFFIGDKWQLYEMSDIYMSEDCFLGLKCYLLFKPLLLIRNLKVLVSHLKKTVIHISTVTFFN